MLTLVFSRFVSEAMVNRSLDLGLIAKETTMFYGHKFVFTVFYKLHLQVKHFTSCSVSAMILNRFNEILYKLHLQVMVL